jgi:uncharacterized protein YigE (DUF2233 family)
LRCLRWLSVSVVLGAAAPVARGAPPAAAARPWIEPGAAWRDLAPGVRSAALVAGGAAVFVVEFDLDRFRADVVVGDGSPPAAQTASDLRVARKAVAAVNGGFFDARRAPLGLRIAGGRTRVPLRPHVDWGVLVIGDGRARIVHSRDFRPDPEIRGAIQVGPRLIDGGVAMKLKRQSARRTAVALDKEGRRLSLICVDRPVEADALAARLAAFGVDSALLLDGGPSTQLSLDIGYAHIDVPGGYPVPDLLVIAPR